MNPQVSVIIPCFNHGQYLEEAIQSVEQYPDQTKYEIIIINDGSTDEQTNHILQRLVAKGYHIIQQENKGLSAARNAGIQAATGKYILPLDADNKIKPAYIEKSLAILEANPAIGIVYADCLYFEDQNRIFKAGKFNRKRMLKDNFIDACVVMRKEVWEQTGGYDTNLTALEDWDFNLSAIEAGWQFYYIPEVLFEYRYRNNSMVRTMTNGEALEKYISQKHGQLYKEEFEKSFSIKARIKTALYDLWQKIKGNPQY